MNQLVLKQVLKTVKRDLAVVSESDCPGCRELAVVRSKALINSLITIVERNEEPRPILFQSGKGFVARYTFVPLDDQEGA
jgi:hypothetical protein